MSDTPEQEAPHSDLDHGFGDVDALLVIAYQAPPSHHPAKGSLNDPAPGQSRPLRSGIEGWFEL